MSLWRGTSLSRLNLALLLPPTAFWDLCVPEDNGTIQKAQHDSHMRSRKLAVKFPLLAMPQVSPAGSRQLLGRRDSPVNTVC